MARNDDVIATSHCHAGLDPASWHETVGFRVGARNDDVIAISHCHAGLDPASWHETEGFRVVPPNDAVMPDLIRHPGYGTMDFGSDSLIIFFFKILENPPVLH